MQMQVVLGVVGRFRDRADRLPDLEAEIPERVEDGFDERLRGGGMSGDEHQQVYIAEWAELGAAVATRGDEADRRSRGTRLQEESVKKDVDRVGPEFSDLAAEDAGTMGRQLNLAGFGQEHLRARDELSLQGRLAG